MTVQELFSFTLGLSISFVIRQYRLSCTETQEENFLRSYTNLVYKAQDPFSSCRQSRFQNKFLIFYMFFVGPSHSYTDQETQEENLLSGTNSFASQFLHPSRSQSSRSIQHMQTVQVPKQVSYFLPVFRGTKSQLYRSSLGQYFYDIMVTLGIFRDY